MSGENNSHVLTLRYLLITAFLSGVPTSRAIWVRIEELINNLVQCLGSENVENIVIDSTFDHELSQKYPRNCIYSNKIKKWLQEIWCKYQWSSKTLVHDTNAETVVIPEPDIGYKTYFLEYDYRYITLLESFEGITKGTTGLNSWGASEALYSWCSENSYVINNRTIIELGAGIGYTAASILSSHHPLNYTATDYHPTVLSILQHNLSFLCDSKCKTREELLSFCSEMKFKMVEEELAPGEFKFWSEGNGSLDAGGTQVTVEQLDWRRPLPPGLPSYDVILAADVVYALHLLPDLVRMIRILLSQSSTQGRRKTKIKTKEETEKGKIRWKGTGNADKDDKSIKIYDNKNKTENETENNNDNKEIIQTQNKVNPIEKIVHKKEIKRMKNIDNHGDKANSDNETDKDKNEIPTKELPPFSFPVAFVACTRRNPETVAAFLEETGNQGLKVKPVFQITLDKDEALFSYNESYKPIIIYKITL